MRLWTFPSEVSAKFSTENKSCKERHETSHGKSIQQSVKIKIVAGRGWLRIRVFLILAAGGGECLKRSK